MRWCCLTLLPALAASVSVSLASWNVYYKALDDPHGRAAIVSAIDAAGALDFVAVIEAAGDSPDGALAAWSNASNTLSGMRSLTTVSRYETLALFFDDARWTPGHVSAGSFDVGRPYLLAPFSSRAQPQVVVWVFAVHLPHFLDTTVDPGAIMAQALRNATAFPPFVEPTNVVLAGDWNEFQWEDNPCPQPIYPHNCRALAAQRMSALWDGYFAGQASDHVPEHSVTCCTKWVPADRGTTDYVEWRFECAAASPRPSPHPVTSASCTTAISHPGCGRYDHIFVAGNLSGPPATELAYAYPGVAQACSDPYCTGEDPPGNVTALYQGSWHRGWAVNLTVTV